MTDIMDADPTEEPGVPAEEPDIDDEPIRFSGIPFEYRYTAIYGHLVKEMAGHTKEPRTALALRQKAADVALNLLAIELRGPQ